MTAARVAVAPAAAKPVARSAAMARRRLQAEPASLNSAGLLRPHSPCACGGGCPRCQAKSALTIGAPDDAYEREADVVADRVMRMAGGVGPMASAVSGIQRKCTACEKEDEEGLVQLKADSSSVATHGDTPAAPSSVDSALSSIGQPLDVGTRAFFEPRFGHDFSGVRVHSGAAAEQSARDVSARAYTVGHDIVFGAGEFAPSTGAGQRLLAHELTHVVQQQADAGAADMPMQRQSEPEAPAPVAEPPPPIPGPTLMMAKPPHFSQNALSCWASAIASWNRVKGLVGANVTEQTLIDSYTGTDCIGKDNMLIGDTDADVEAVFAEWRLSLSLSTEVPELGWTFDLVKSLIEKHGHFVVVTGSGVMHVMVVYGVRLDDKRDPTQFTVFVEDPMSSNNDKAGMFFERPIRVALGTEKKGSPAPCRKRAPRKEEEE